MWWWLSLVIVTTSEIEIGKIIVSGQVRQKKFMKPHFNRKGWV
jgi:hypothetical protein